jgi:hypothetical protein
MNKLPAHPPVFILTPSQRPTLNHIYTPDPITSSYSTIIWPITASACLYFYQGGHWVAKAGYSAYNRDHEAPLYHFITPQNIHLLYPTGQPAKLSSQLKSTRHCLILRRWRYPGKGELSSDRTTRWLHLPQQISQFNLPCRSLEPSQIDQTLKWKKCLDVGEKHSESIKSRRHSQVFVPR